MGAMLRGLILTGIFTVLNVTAATPEAAAWQTLDNALKNPNAGNRRMALAALGTLGEPNQRAVKYAEDALKDKDSLVRQSAALALGQMEAKEAIPNLKAALNDNNEVAFAAAKSLIDLGDESGRKMMVAVVSGQRKDTPGMMTRAERDAKSQLHHPEKMFFMGAQGATSAFVGPASAGIGAVHGAVDLYGQGTPSRAVAVAYLAKLPGPTTVRSLESAINDKNPAVRAEAAKGLGDIGDPTSIPALEIAMRDQHALVRTAAAASIIRMSSPRPQHLEPTAENQGK